MSRGGRAADTARDAERSDLCGRCAAICCRLTVVLTAADDVPAWLVDVPASGPDQLRKAPDGWCAALDRDTLRCSIYAQRPQACRRFATGGRYCMDERRRWSAGQRDGGTPTPRPARLIPHTALPAA